MRTFVDRGGTFTDIVVVHDDGRVRVSKVPSDRAVVGELAQGRLTFGTTVATNAVLENQRARTLLLVTRGFGDLARIRDMARPELFDPEATWPDPPCDAVVEIGGRLAADGNELAPLELPDGLDLEGFEAVAIALLHAPCNPSHELALAAWLAARTDAWVAVGHEVAPEVGYLARIETTLIDAAFTPILRAALHRDRIGPDALAMRSDGSLVAAHDLRAPDAVLSGPAGGVLAVAAIAERAGFARAVGLDMGGTSTDVCCVEAGHPPRRLDDLRIAGLRVRRPALEVETIAAGGGSILSTDGRTLSVGPRSAGADPGPQCYGRGGPPTLTDAALAAGLVDPDAFDPPLDLARVDLPGEAHAFLTVAREAMAAAVRRLAAARGLDLREHALVAYGGAAGQHAAEVATRLGIDTVLVHPACAVLCAWGHGLARSEESRVRALWRPLHTAWEEVGRAWGEERAAIPLEGDETWSIDARYAGTDGTLEVGLARHATAVRAAEAFHAMHTQTLGFRRDAPVEVVNVRVRVRAPAKTVPWPQVDPWNVGPTPRPGPSVLRAPTTSVAVPAGWTARWDRGLLRLERANPSVNNLITERTPLGASVWGSRFMAVAEQAGEVLQRLARSVNIRERRDFSCAVFDGDGRLIANAPHVPVHLGAMGATVRDLLARHPDPDPHQAWLCNDPGAGGSHLPDLTVVSPVEHQGHRFFVACRGHHVDVGGTTPGSMPPVAHHLREEGLVLTQVPLLAGGRIRPDLAAILAGSRQVDTVIADLEAQLAANAHAARALVALGPASVLAAWMQHLVDLASESVVAALGRLEGEASDTLAGVPLRLALRTHGGRLEVSLQGCGPPHSGNLNAPLAVVRAAVLYALRVVVDQPLPLNEGALERVDLDLPSPSIVSPPPGSAVAGGNVETSQRLVDLFLRATGRMAASAGTMNNLTLGGAGWSLYETIGGGQGASSRGPGPSGRQLHMTNTRATDPEVLERRLPLRLEWFALRPRSGGSGQHRGGDGLERAIRVLVPATAALLATRRRTGAPGLDGGGAGLPGEQHLVRAGDRVAWDGAPIALDPGDMVVVRTPGGGGWGRP